MSARHEKAAKALSAESRAALINAHENGYVPAPTAELVMTDIIRGAYLTVFGEVVRHYVVEQELEGLG